MTRSRRSVTASSACRIIVIVALLAFTAPGVAANDFLIQNQTDDPLFLVNGTSSNVGIGLLNPQFSLDVSGSARIQGELDMFNNNISSLNALEGYYGSGCGSGRVVNSIYDNGTFQCANVTQEITDQWVDESGDTMGGNLSMAGNWIRNVGNLTGTDIIHTPQIAAQAVGTGELATAVAGTGLSGGGGSALSVNTGDGLGTAGDNLQVTTGRGITISGGNVAVDDALVPITYQQETINASQWIFENNLTVKGNLDVWGNITNTDVQHLNINGSLLPQQGYNNTFDVGSSQRWWADGYFGGSIRVDGTTDGVDLDSPGNAISISGSNQYQVEGNSIGANELVYAYEHGAAYDGRFVNASGDTMTGNLDVNGNEVQNLVSNSAGDAVNRSWVNDNDDVQDADSDPNNELQNLSEVLVQGNVANTSINMSGKNIGAVNDIRFNGGGNALSKLRLPNESSAALRVEDSDGTGAIMQWKDSGVTEIHGGQLELNGNNIALGGDSWLSMDGDNEGITVDLDGNVGINVGSPNSVLHIKDNNGAATGSILFNATVSSSYRSHFQLNDTGLHIGHNSGSRDLQLQTAETPGITIDASQNVEVPNGNLDMNGNNVTGVERVEMGGGHELVKNGDELCLGDECL